MPTKTGVVSEAPERRKTMKLSVPFSIFRPERRQAFFSFMVNRICPILYPRHCPVCQRTLPYGRIVCEKCLLLLPRVREPVCFCCGKPVLSEAQELCYDCRTFPKSFQRGLALFLYNEITRPFMADFKYHNRRFLAYFFSDEIIKTHHSLLLSWHIQAVIPVPVHKNKRKKRGYNQAALLGRELAVRLHLPCYPKLLLRIVDTLPQKHLNPRLRLKNIQNAFCINPSLQPLVNHLQTVLLVDDIYTTGSTLEACTRVLHEAGVRNVYVCSVCIGVARD